MRDPFVTGEAQQNGLHGDRMFGAGSLWTRPLYTPRLTLRWFMAADASSLAALARDALIRQRTDTIPYPFDHQAALSWIAQSEALRIAGASYRFAVVDPVSDQLMGVVALEQCRSEVAEIAYWLGRSFWERGFAREAVSAALAFARDVLTFDRVDALAHAENMASVSVLRGQGFAEFGFETLNVPERGGNRLARRFRVVFGEEAPLRFASESRVA